MCKECVFARRIWFTKNFSLACQNTKKKRMPTVPEHGAFFSGRLFALIQSPQQTQFWKPPWPHTSSSVCVCSKCYWTSFLVAHIVAVGQVVHKEKQPVCLLQLPKAIFLAKSLLILQDHFVQLIPSNSSLSPPCCMEGPGLSISSRLEDSINRAYAGLLPSDSTPCV